MGRVINILIAVIIVLLLISGCQSDEEKKKAHFKKGQAYVASDSACWRLVGLQPLSKIDPRYLEANLNLGETYLKLAS